MAHINFLEPPRFSLRQFNLKNFELNYFWMMVIAGILLVFMVIYGLVQQRRVSSLNNDLTIAAAEAKKGAKQTAKPGAPQKPTLMDAFQQRIQWSPILNAIANHTPDTVSLNFIKGLASSRSVQIEGVGADVLAAARYEDDLSSIPLFSRVVLQSSLAKESGAAKGAAEKADTKTEAKTDAKSVAVSAGRTQLTFEIQGWVK